MVRRSNHRKRHYSKGQLSPICKPNKTSRFNRLLVTSMKFQLTLKSENAKTGPIPVSISSSKTCPSACPLRNNGCYAQQGPLLWNWKHVTNGDYGLEWPAFLAAIAALPAGQLWRHNQAGDLPGLGNTIASGMLRELVAANQGKRGFTYTHKPVVDHERNQAAVKHANDNGFTVNMSADNLNEADELAALNIGPVVVVLPSSQQGNTTTPSGRKVVQCPATRQGYKTTCAECKLCSVANRSCVVGFPAHGPQQSKVNKIAGTQSAS